MNRTPLSTLVLGSALAAVACHRTSGTAPAVTPETARVTTPHATEPAELPTVTVDDLAARLARHDNVAVYDVNNREHYEQRHIPGARFAVFDQVQPSDLPADHATPLVFYCANEH